MPILRTGCGPLPTRRDTYASEFNLAEFTEMAQQPIGAPTLRKWARALGPSVACITVAWHWLTLDWLDAPKEVPEGCERRDLGFFRATPSNELIWKRCLEQARAVDAKKTLFRTPPSFTPTDENKERITSFLTTHVVASGIQPVWEARGMWTLDEQDELTRSCGALLALDPFGDEELPPIPEGEAYYVMNGPRGRRDFSEDDFLDLIEFFGAHDGTVNVVFRGADRERDARAFTRLARKHGLGDET